ncbi:hypothetical protein [Mycoplasma sp. Mirounga ES2805-ORL]|uniref:hypothetical protein n=1 Tax=Mycoplasma sp. Mirounga ES2805-ORL TaxID=754514 RepID=UPI00197C8741|nr:hypothetical protein [Mycoplasma sp. Mirounga ES2805-ORL]QSF13943.1 hypothetical protein JXZ90_01475 [Mycoplasma sp. Mirounga ES2805-ORL]
MKKEYNSCWFNKDEEILEICKSRGWDVDLEYIKKVNYSHLAYRIGYHYLNEKYSIEFSSVKNIFEFSLFLSKELYLFFLNMNTIWNRLFWEYWVKNLIKM